MSDTVTNPPEGGWIGLDEIDMDDVESPELAELLTGLAAVDARYDEQLFSMNPGLVATPTESARVDMFIKLNPIDISVQDEVLDLLRQSDSAVDERTFAILDPKDAADQSLAGVKLVWVYTESGPLGDDGAGGHVGGINVFGGGLADGPEADGHWREGWLGLDEVDIGSVGDPDLQAVLTGLAGIDAQIFKIQPASTTASGAGDGSGKASFAHLNFTVQMSTDDREEILDHLRALDSALDDADLLILNPPGEPEAGGVSKLEIDVLPWSWSAAVASSAAWDTLAGDATPPQDAVDIADPGLDDWLG